jgi:hypothetical protein
MLNVRRAPIFWICVFWLPTIWGLPHPAFAQEATSHQHAVAVSQL